jgi:hypothetical protein
MNPPKNSLLGVLSEFLPDILELQTDVQKFVVMASALCVAVFVIAGVYSFLNLVASKCYDLVGTYARYQFGHSVQVHEIIQPEAPEVYFQYFQAPNGQMRGWVLSRENGVIGTFPVKSRRTPEPPVLDNEIPEMAVAGAPPLRPAPPNRHSRMVIVSGDGGVSLGLASVLSINGEFYLVTAQHVADKARGIFNFVGDVGLPFPKTTVSYCDVSFSKLEKKTLSRMKVRASGSPTGAKTKPGKMIVLRGDVATVDLVPVGRRKPNPTSSWNFAFYHKSRTRPGDSGGLIFQGDRPVAIHVGADSVQALNVAVNLGPLVKLLFPSDEVEESYADESDMHTEVDWQLLEDEHIDTGAVRFSRNGKHWARKRKFTSEEFHDFVDLKPGRWGDDELVEQSDFRKVSPAAHPSSKPPSAPESNGTAKKKRQRKRRSAASPSSDSSPVSEVTLGGVTYTLTPKRSESTSPIS